MSTLSAGSLKPGAAAEPPLGLHLPLRVQQGQQGLSCCPHPPRGGCSSSSSSVAPAVLTIPARGDLPYKPRLLLSQSSTVLMVSQETDFFFPLFFLAFKTHEYGSSENRELGTVEWSTGSSEPSAGVTLSP